MSRSSLARRRQTAATEGAHTVTTMILGFIGDSFLIRAVSLESRSSVAMGIRKVQYAPSKQGRQPCTVVRKDFMMSPGELELEVTLDKQLYHHGEKIAVNICIRNNSNKVVKKIKAMVQQGVDVVLFQNGQYRSSIASVETQSVCILVNNLIIISSSGG